MGTTSACAENTGNLNKRRRRRWNYLRVRGEYPQGPHRVGAPKELPPRARRIRLRNTLSRIILGTTSACAENTTQKGMIREYDWNYLRVRGEYVSIKPLITSRSELPPRARRIPPEFSWGEAGRGTTSACAENTIGENQPTKITGNYLRVRGEYSAIFARNSSAWELPPRARRIPLS